MAREPTPDLADVYGNAAAKVANYLQEGYEGERTFPESSVRKVQELYGLALHTRNDHVPTPRETAGYQLLVEILRETAPQPYSSEQALRRELHHQASLLVDLESKTTEETKHLRAALEILVERDEEMALAQVHGGAR